MITEVDISIGRRMRRRRLQLGRSQHDVARAIGVGFQQIHKYECGCNRIAASRLWLIALALDTTVSYFFESLTPPRGIAPGIDAPERAGREA